MNIQKMKHTILLDYKKKGYVPGEMIDMAFWEGTFLHGADSKMRELFWSAVDELIEEGCLQQEPIRKNGKSLGTLKQGLWLLSY